MSGLALDLSKSHFKFRRGPMFAVGTWVRGMSEDGGWEPCLVLFRSGDEGTQDLIPCLVTYNQAWVWSEDIGDPRIAAQTAASFCDAMRFTVDPHHMILVASTIHDLLGDLLSIPPYPEREVIGHMLVTNTETGAETEVALVDV
jgi:hypothetical protein